ncbi:MAG: DUF599 domain-containing protein [Rhodospirillaceae bacterium]|nr:DUF599 domain-containing protein [Rhodospirillaceae bacterium]
MLDTIGIANILALVWFGACWVGYTFYADNVNSNRHTLLTAMRDKRELWMKRMIGRENRMVDASIMSTLMRSVSLFASTTIFILAGLLAVLGSADKAQALLHEIPFAVVNTGTQWEIKILLLLIIFVYAFFKFAWALRQFNYAIVLLGAAPPMEEAGSNDANEFAAANASVISLAVLSFNRGLRAYYFGLAALSWFIHPALLAVATMWVVAVLYRREFMSKTLDCLDNVPMPDGSGRNQAKGNG